MEQPYQGFGNSVYCLIAILWEDLDWLSETAAIDVICSEGLQKIQE